MKKSIAFLPQHKQDDLNFFVEEIKKRVKSENLEMILLYGSYARNEYVNHSVRIEDGIPVVKISDYDIMVVTSGVNSKKVGVILDNIEDVYYTDPDNQPPVQFVTEDIKNLNKFIEQGVYFYTLLKHDGIIFYDSGKYKLARRRTLNFDEIQKQAREYFDEKFYRGNSFLYDAEGAYKREDYKQASFHLHQACENFYYAIGLTFKLTGNKQHNLSKLTAATRKYSDELVKVFPRHTAEEKRLFALIKAAYVDARYTTHFVVTKEDIDTLIPKVELLRDITKRICEGKIKEYREK